LDSQCHKTKKQQNFSPKGIFLDFCYIGLGNPLGSGSGQVLSLDFAFGLDIAWDQEAWEGQKVTLHSRAANPVFLQAGNPTLSYRDAQSESMLCEGAPKGASAGENVCFSP
jgi:hypothetical protein